VSTLYGTKVPTAEEYRRKLAQYEALGSSGHSDVSHETLSSLDHEKAVVVNRYIDMNACSVLGFDVDYTLTQWKPTLQAFLFSEAMSSLVQDRGYPRELLQSEFDPEFPIRGLHFDAKHGTLLKLNAFYDICHECAYLGKERLSLDQLRSLYGGTHVRDPHSRSLRSLDDHFSLAEACLLAECIHYFRSHGYSFAPEFIHQDVTEAVRRVHVTGALHQELVSRLPYYLHRDEPLRDFMRSAQAQGKQSFILTNSPYWFVDAGLRYIIGDDWNDFFDIVITRANKPTFFTADTPFRTIISDLDCPQIAEQERVSWRAVRSMEKGERFVAGSLTRLVAATGWEGSSVLYLGDSLRADAAWPGQLQSWRTGVIIPELSHELRLQHTPEYQHLLDKVIVLEQLKADAEWIQEAELPRGTTDFLRAENAALRSHLREVASPTFGSVFRGRYLATLFMRTLEQADLYTAKVTNLGEVLDKRLYSRRRFLPHEVGGD
jgi:HAD superfamily 5'-nucleotidase-like hydrolase